MFKKKINKLIIKIFSLNKDEIIVLNTKNLYLKNLENFDSLKFVKFLTTIEKTFKIDIKQNDFEFFFSSKKIYEFFKKNKNDNN